MKKFLTFIDEHKGQAETFSIVLSLIALVLTVFSWNGSIVNIATVCVVVLNFLILRIGK